MQQSFLCLAVSFLLWTGNQAFQVAQPSKPSLRSPLRSSVATTRPNRLSLTLGALLDDNDNYNDDGMDFQRYQEALDHNTRRTDVRIFLTQRAIQSFSNLLITCRDPHTVRWLENTYSFSNLAEYHGTGAFNLTTYDRWDTILLHMLQQPPEVVIVSARRRGRGHGGWSKNNPHLEDRFVEFEIDIDPPSLVTRILSVRQQISDEWVTDLGTMKTINGQILASYYDRQSLLRDEECRTESAVDDNCAGADTSTPTHEQIASSGAAAQDQNSGYFLHNKIMEESENDGRASSPVRKGNFDLLALLATQEALHRVLRSYQETGDERSVSFLWLRQFYVDRLQVFDGDGAYGRSDGFLQELLMTPPSTREIVGNGQTHIGLVDPLRIAQDLLEARSDIIDEWVSTMRDHVPSDHMELQKSILDVRMGKTISSSTPGSADAASPQGIVFREDQFQ